MMRRYSSAAAADQEWQIERRRNAWALVWMMAIPVVFVGVAVWWLESRFGSGVALMILGGLVGVVCVIIGIVLALGVQRNTLSAASQFNTNLAMVERERTKTEVARYGIDRERARSERALTEARARIEVIDAKRVDKIAQARAQALLTDARQRPQAPTWGRDVGPDDAAWTGGDDVTFYE